MDNIIEIMKEEEAYREKIEDFERKICAVLQGCGCNVNLYLTKKGENGNKRDKIEIYVKSTVKIDRTGILKLQQLLGLIDYKITLTDSCSSNVITFYKWITGVLWNEAETKKMRVL